MLIDDCERLSGALSLEPTPFTMEQAVNFLVSTVPDNLRRLDAALDELRGAVADLLRDDDMPNHWDDCVCSYCTKHRRVVEALKP